MKICSLDKCGLPHKSKGFCPKHYQRYLKHGDTSDPTFIKKNATRSHPLYGTYWNMLRRCASNTNKHYFLKGISVCESWGGENGFVNFCNDMGERPGGFQLDRIDNSGNYSKNNCRWVNKYVQMGNTSTNNLVPGVGWHSQRKKYRARIKVNGKEISLGLFKTYEEAVNARLSKEKELCIQ